MIFLVDLGDVKIKRFSEIKEGMFYEMEDKSLLFFIDEKYWDNPSRVRIDIKFTEKK